MTSAETTLPDLSALRTPAPADLAPTVLVRVGLADRLGIGIGAGAVAAAGPALEAAAADSMAVAVAALWAAVLGVETVGPDDAFVRVKAGEYLFVPGLNALKGIIEKKSGLSP